jgi:ABC-2 type transport system ATP-binding protein
MDSSPHVGTDGSGLAEPVRTPFLRVAGVTKRYGSFAALSGIDLSVASGETLALLGPNGAGKTTLMQLMAGVLQPDSGQISLEGLGAPTRASVRRALGYAPQALAVYPQLSARENLQFFARLHGVSRSEAPERVQFGLELADLGSRAEQRAGTFSGGMQRRLNLACAVVHRPRLLLLDEPTVGVDPHSRHHLLEAVAALRSLGMALIYSTHLMDEADRLCDRVAVMDRGRLLALGASRGLCEAHGCTGLGDLFLRLTGKELRD